jgi:hypothetical protein
MDNSTKSFRRPVIFVCAPSAILAAAAIMLAGSACANPFGACTLIGCTDGLRLTFDAPPPQGTVVEIVHFDAPPWRVECGVDTNCAVGIFFSDFTPSDLTVRVVTPGGEVTESYQPTYQEHRPNGEGCGPECLNATILVALPA